MLHRVYGWRWVAFFWHFLTAAGAKPVHFAVSNVSEQGVVAEAAVIRHRFIKSFCHSADASSLALEFPMSQSTLGERTKTKHKINFLLCPMFSAFNSPLPNFEVVLSHSLIRRGFKHPINLAAVDQFCIILPESRC